MTQPATHRVISGFPLRRAVLGILLNADGPVTVTDIVDALHAAGVTTSPGWSSHRAASSPTCSTIRSRPAE